MAFGEIFISRIHPLSPAMGALTEESFFLPISCSLVVQLFNENSRGLYTISVSFLIREGSRADSFFDLGMTLFTSFNFLIRKLVDIFHETVGSTVSH